MIVFGLTGSICSGKSLVASYFKIFKAAVFDADLLVHQLYQHDKEVIQLAKEHFPNSIQNGIIDRKLLSKHFFEYNKPWIEFQKKIHAIILKKQHNFILLQKRYGTQYVILDVPLLIEANFHHSCNFIIRVSTKPFLKKQRIIKRNISEEKIRFISSHQITEFQRKKLSHFTINTSLNKYYIFQQVKKILNKVNT